jgi:hypothetical protein
MIRVYSLPLEESQGQKRIGKKEWFELRSKAVQLKPLFLQYFSLFMLGFTPAAHGIS